MARTTEIKVDKTLDLMDILDGDPKEVDEAKAICEELVIPKLKVNEITGEAIFIINEFATGQVYVPVYTDDDGRKLTNCLDILTKPDGSPDIVYVSSKNLSIAAMVKAHEVCAEHVFFLRFLFIEVISKGYDGSTVNISNSEPDIFVCEEISIRFKMRRITKITLGTVQELADLLGVGAKEVAKPQEICIEFGAGPTLQFDVLKGESVFFPAIPDFWQWINTPAGGTGVNCSDLLAMPYGGYRFDSDTFAQVPLKDIPRIAIVKASEACREHDFKVLLTIQVYQCLDDMCDADYERAIAMCEEITKLAGDTSSGIEEALEPVQDL